MKMKNLTRLHTLLLMLVVSSAMILGSCKKDDDDKIVEGDKTELNALIAEAQALADAATTADYPEAAITTFKTTLATIKTTAATSLTQVQIDNLLTQLSAAITTFNSKAYGFIDEALYLNAGWHFDEGTGTIATAFSSTAHVGTFTKGNPTVFGADAMMPSWADGVIGKAVLLNKGGHLEVPYSASFLPANITISVWVNPLEIYENNYIVSQNFWNGYKLQTQSVGKPFFTYKTVDGNIIDKDNVDGGSVVVNQWNHIVVSLNSVSKELKFYLNGELSYTWTATDGILPITQTLTDPDPQAFLIGCVATDAQIATWSWTETPTSLGYFKGSVDELKVYNIALSDGQIAKLYNDEKP